MGTSSQNEKPRKPSNIKGFRGFIMAERGGFEPPFIRIQRVSRINTKIAKNLGIAEFFAIFPLKSRFFYESKNQKWVPNGYPNYARLMHLISDGIIFVSTDRFRRISVDKHPSTLIVSPGDTSASDSTSSTRAYTPLFSTITPLPCILSLTIPSNLT